MLNIKDEGIILQKTELSFENKAVFNPTCVEKDGIVHMFYRAIGQDDISSIGYCQLIDNKVVKRLEEPIIFPEYDYEKKGVEDPRITLLDGVYYLFYTAYDGQNALICYATSQDLKHFTKQGIISPTFSYDEAEDIFRDSIKTTNKYTLFEILYKENSGKDILLFEKDASLFPLKINNKFALVHRVLPGIQIIYFDKFSDLNNDYWRNYFKTLDKYIALDPVYEFENRNIGGGGSPIETKDGWLIIYHTVQDAPEGRIYHASAALLDLENPLKVMGRLRKPLFSPNAEWEKKGNVSNVVFPTGVVVRNDRIYIYYGAADSVIGGKSLLLSELLNELKIDGI
jgi:predicted GH43/DUF377 family glycosyl hydrolase